MSGIARIRGLFALPEEAGAAGGAPSAQERRRAGIHTALTVLAVGVAVGVAEVLAARASGAAGAFSWAAAGRSLASCVIAGVVEEAIFRGAAFPLLVAALRPSGGGGGEAGQPQPQPQPGGSGASCQRSALSRAVFAAAVIQAALFAILHLTGTLPRELTWVVGVQALAKVAGAFAFGMCMAALYLCTRNVLAPIGVHVAYDLVSMLPREAICGPTVTYLTGSLADAVILAGTAVALAVPAVLGWHVLRAAAAR